MMLTPVERDWPLAYETAKYCVERAGSTVVAWSKRPGVPHRSTWYRLRDGQGDARSSAKIRAIAGSLGLPGEFLSWVADHDLETIKESVDDPDLIAWLTRQITARSRNAG